MNRSARTGFTLIELLVVIAIIGVLSSVVMASLNSARGKGSDAGVLSNVGTVVTQAAIYQDNNNQSLGTFNNNSGGAAACPKPGTTGTSVFHDPTIENAIAAAVADSGGGAAYCFATPSSYAVAVSRPASVVPTKSYFWCADSSGIKCGNDGVSGSGATPIVEGSCVACTVHN